jgi:hypothetical protein
MSGHGLRAMKIAGKCVMALDEEKSRSLVTALSGARNKPRDRVRSMSVLAIFKYDVKPGRMVDFMAKLQAAADPVFNSPVMPQKIRLFRSTVPGPDTGTVILMIEYADMAAYGSRTSFENNNAAWKKLFASQPDSPETLLSVELLTEV